jgi:WD40 repeat protein
LTRVATFAAGTSPYQGLRNYGEKDADFFFGRDQERDIIIANLKATRLTVLYGPSGVGKTSLLRAGVEASLRKFASTNYERLGTPEFVTVVFGTWQDDPRTGLSKAIAQEVERLTGASAEPENSLADTIMAAAGRTDASLLVILDQFEDLSLYHSSRNGADPFAAEFPRLVKDRRLPVSFLISIREDAIAQLDRFKNSIPGLLDTRLRVQPLMGEAAREAVAGPITKYNELVGSEPLVTIEDELVTAVLNQVEIGKVRRKHAGQGVADSLRSDTDGDIGANGPGVEGTRGVEASYLQLVMRRLWEREMSPTLAGDGAHTLRLATLQELGGAEKIVREHLDEALSDLSPDARDAAVDVFQYLVTPSGTKITQGLGTLVTWSGQSGEEVESLLAKLGGDARIIRPVPPEPGSDEPRYEIFHDVLADAILEWSEGESEKRRLAELARDNVRLEQEKHQAEKRAAVERRRRLFAVALLLLALAGGVAAVVFWRSAVAERNTAQHEKARATYVGLASTAQALLQTRPDISLLLALEAYLHRPPKSSRALAQGTLMAALEEVLRSGPRAILHGHLDTVTTVAFDPNGHLLASGSGDGTIRLWNTRTLKQVGEPLSGPGGGVFSVAFSPHGHTLASSYENGTVRLWDLRSQHPVSKSTIPGGSAVNSVAFSPKGGKLAAASLSGKIRLWDLGNAERLGASHDLPDPSVRGIAFSADGGTLAAVGADPIGNKGRIRLWDVAKRRWRGDVSRGSPFYTVAFNPKRNQLAAGGLDGRVWLWNLADQNPTRGLREAGAIDGVAFNPTGQSLAAATADGTIQLWDVAGESLSGPRLLSGHTGMVTSVAFGDRNTLASGSTDRTIRLWNPQPHPGFEDTLSRGTESASALAFAPFGHLLASAHRDHGHTSTIQLWDTTSLGPLTHVVTQRGDVRSLAFSPDRKLLVSTSQGGTVQLWHVPSLQADGGPVVSGPGAPIFSAAFSPNGRWLAFAGAEGMLGLRNLHTNQPVPLHTGSRAAVYTVAFSRDSTELASGGDDRKILLWNVATGRHIAPLSGHTDAVFTVVFGPKDSLLASGSGDDTIRLWNLSNHQPRGQPLTGHHGYVRSIAFSPDGRTLASGSADGTIRLWDVTSRTQLGDALSAPPYVNAVAFSPDGRTLAAASRDGAIRLWTPISLPPNNTALKNKVCGLVGTGLSASELSSYAPAFTYHNPCPKAG